MSKEKNTSEKNEKPCGCSGEITMPELDASCIAPTPMPGVQCTNCMKWFFTNTVTKQAQIPFGGKDDTANFQVPVTIQFEVTYQFSLCLKGRQPGKLLYTTSLIPQEQLTIYISDRFRKTTSATAMVSVHSTFRQSIDALYQSQASQSKSTYTDTIKNSNEGGGASFSFLGIINIGGSAGENTTTQTAQSLQSSMQTFQQNVFAASSSVEAQRSLVVSSYEDQENITTTSRTLKNFNNCRAVTYYVRQVNEVYELSASVVSIKWRIVEGRLSNVTTDWQDISTISSVTNEALKKLLLTEVAQLPKAGEVIKSEVCINIPSDGTLLEAELAHCSSCDEERMMELELSLEKAKAETHKLLVEAELLHLEVERRKKLLSAGDLHVFDTPETSSTNS